jgi:hypothetical protein
VIRHGGSDGVADARLALARRLKAARPSLRVLYMSGYTNDTLLERGRPEPGTSVIAKPFTQELMNRKLRELLGEVD